MEPAQAQAASQGEARPHPVRDELPQLLKLSGPVVLSRLGIMAMGLTDAVVVGRYSATELGYHALGWAPTSVVLTALVGLLVGVQVMTARAIGEGRREGTGAVLRRGVVYAFWLGVISTGALAVAGPPFLHAIGLERDLADGASRALLVFSLSLTGYSVSVACSFWLEGLSRPGPAAIAMWAANVVNLLLVLLFVPGTMGLPAGGAVGAAWATFGARTFLALAMLGFIATMPEARALGVFRKPEIDRPGAAEQMRIGFGAGISNFLEVASFASMNVIAGWLGGLAVAAWAIVLNVAAIVFMVPLGLATGAAVLVGKAYGARDNAGVNRAGAVSFGVTAVFGVLVTLIVWPAAELITRGYTTDTATIAIAAPALALAVLMFLPDCLQVVAAQALRARGDVWLPTGAHLTSYILIMMPLAYVLAIPMKMHLMGIVWAVVIASVVSAVLLLARFWLLSRRAL
ncbi:MATE family efflux transporter [Phenylobacterium sp.]|uniref:MATE family efflux transporter n=1 Tax=Phenylobacterium sp. TaxID=1871053 RepID=UPI0035B1B27D